MLRACNALRIAHLPALRNDGLGRASPACAPRPTRNPAPTSHPTSLIFDICYLISITSRTPNLIIQTTKQEGQILC
ncbi:MAG: hypothetical protein LBM98_08890 [Oscillospiraceae bacterium]|nr:hypothetical protein [Oscillospiraceae bacterium]